MNQVTDRKYYIDWVRVLAFMLLIFFHCAMPFVSFNWEIKNKETSAGLSRLIWWLHQWRLPLLFFISGVGIHFSLQKRSVISFAGERFVRLFIPLLFAMFFVIPIQVYFEKLQRGIISGSYFDFYPTVWNFIPYPDGTLTWSHMWFVVYLFVFCILLLPVFVLFKIKSVKIFKQKLGDFLAHPLGLIALAVPFIVYYFKLFLKYPEQQSLLDDWFLFTFSITLVLYGYLLGGNDKFWKTCEKYRFYFLSAAMLCIVILFCKYWWNMDIPKKEDSNLYMFGILSAINIWFLILAVLGFAKRYLNFTNRFLRYTTQAVYPFYILHQTLIVAFGYYVVQWPVPIFAKLFILILVCFVSILVLYNWLIKPFVIPRVLYGPKPKEAKNGY
jgi:glucans biosynthesis protein C